MKLRSAFASMLLVASASAPAAPDVGTATLVKDLERDATEPLTYVPIFRPLEVAPAVYFFQDDGVHGIELWRSDGTAAGTGLVVDLCPGRCDAVGEDALRGIAALGSTVLFAGSDGVHGVELWATDGTSAGTHMVKDILPGADSSSPRKFQAGAGAVYFTAEDGVHGRELWRTDGTTAGTALYCELAPGSAAMRIEFLGIAPGLVYVGLDPNWGPSGVWRCDGTPTGTLQLAPTVIVSPALARLGPMQLLPDGRLLFAGRYGSGVRPWVSDGTVAGTHLLVESNLGPVDARSFFRFEGLTYFVGRLEPLGSPTQLWKTDGTEAGTVRIAIPAGVSLAESPDRLGVVGSRAILMAADSTHGVEPWVLENDQLTLLRDINPGDASSTWFDSYSYTYHTLVAEAAGRVLFLADDGVSGFQLWSTDGTTNGTVRITELAGTDSTWPFDQQTYTTQRDRFAGPLFFRLADPLLGQTLWKSDGTVAGTGVVAELLNQRSSFYPTRRRSPYAPRLSKCAEPTAGRLLFSTFRFSSAANELWGTDGSASGTVPLASLVDYYGLTQAPACGARHGRALFYAPDDYQSYSWGLFGTDGTVAGTSKIHMLDESSQWSEPTFVDLGAQHFGSYGGLVRTDGTPGGTWTESFEDLALITSAGGSLWGAGETRLVRTEGLSAAPRVLFDGGPGSSPQIRDLSPLAGGVAFLATRDDIGRELWWSDGTAEGTAPVVDLLPGAASAAHPPEFPLAWQDGSSGRRLESLGAFGVVALDDGMRGTELWRTDGTAAGTTLLKDIYSGPYPSTPRDLVRVGDVVYFTAEDELHGLELWVTDGTKEGTHLVADLVPGTGSSAPQELTAVNGRLYFSAWRPRWGREAFRSDGTKAGTLQVADVWPGTGSSSPSRFAAVRDTLYFAANDGEHGFELFKVIDATLLDVFADGFEGGSLGAWSRQTGP